MAQEKKNNVLGCVVGGLTPITNDANTGICGILTRNGVGDYQLPLSIGLGLGTYVMQVTSVGTAAIPKVVDTSDVSKQIVFLDNAGAAIETKFMAIIFST